MNLTANDGEIKASLAFCQQLKDNVDRTTIEFLETYSQLHQTLQEIKPRNVRMSNHLEVTPAFGILFLDNS